MADLHTAESLAAADGLAFVRGESHIYVCIDLKSFYASVECAERGLDPFTANLAVADPTRSETTICLAISPALKALGVPNRSRLFEIPPGIDVVIAPPRMKLYMQKSAEIYATYRSFVSEEDIYPYSIDECFVDATPYLKLYKCGPRAFATMLRDAVFERTGISATAGIGTNMFLAKVALDVTAKHAPDMIGVLDQRSFRQQVWFHRPITDIWQVGPGIARRLAKYGIHDLHGICEIDPETMYREFGKQAEYLIDHAWGVEPCTIAQVKAYTPSATSMTNGQVLPGPYSFDEARVVLREMVEGSSLEMVEKGLVAGGVSVFCGYERDRSVPAAPVLFEGGHGKIRERGAHTGGSSKLLQPTNAFHALWKAVSALYDVTADRETPLRRLNVSFFDLTPESGVQASLFYDDASDAKDSAIQHAMVDVKARFGKNALLHASSLTEKATARERNNQVGGHRAE